MSDYDDDFEEVEPVKPQKKATKVKTPVVQPKNDPAAPASQTLKSPPGPAIKTISKTARESNKNQPVSGNSQDKIKILPKVDNSKQEDAYNLKSTQLAKP